jgi:hypothetical protein
MPKMKKAPDIQPGPRYRGPVRLPHDGATYEEISALCGPVKTYKGGAPCQK